ncbi:Hpt domain-containing protein [Thalassovita sp.]|uniref:Hpt domain-containing protein n=1 Tax=Thalassovita sp. TaxID=1979401 RepID=UPI0028816710|nr:Hpt domain-containing protein [Thalassovita sp.]MDF1802410.1 Hpt domain-containing protein [Thalassovita sp.]
MVAEALQAARSAAHAEIFQAKLAEMRPRFAATLGDRLDHMEELRDSDTLNTAPADAMEVFRHYAHKTAGMAATMGFPELGELCFAAEMAVNRYMENPVELPTALNAVDDMLGEMALIVDGA